MNLPQKVKLVNNPYLQRLSILIDGKNISPYSSLHQYMNAPFYEWCDCIFESLAKQFNGKSFSLQFSSSDEEMLIMNILANKYSICDGCTCTPLIRNISTMVRLKKLHELIRRENIQNYEFQDIYSLFVLSSELELFRNDLLHLEIENIFCKLHKKIVSFKEFQQMRNHTYETLFVITGKKLSDEKLKPFVGVNGFLIQISDSFPEKISFHSKLGGLFIYQVQKNFLIQAIFTCMLFAPLVQALRRCVASLPSEVKKLYKKSLAEIQSISNNVIPIAENSIIEVGRSVHIRFDSDIVQYPISVNELSYTYNREGIIRCNGLLVEGLREGSCTMYVQRKGEGLPCAEISFKVIGRNRIQKIVFEERTLVVAEDSECVVRFSVQPTDADNLSQITWSTSDSDIAYVSGGLLIAKKQGICDIRCIAENVSAKFRCVVRPVLISIILEEESLKIPCGEKQTLKIRIFPENAIDGKLLISSMDMRVANVVGREIHGVGKGNTRIIIENESHTVRKEIPIKVFKENFFTKFFK